MFLISRPPAFNSNDLFDLQDICFFVDCLHRPDTDAAGPSCKWADMNADGTAYGDDIAQLTAAPNS